MGEEIFAAALAMHSQYLNLFDLAVPEKYGLRPALICGDSHSSLYMRPEAVSAGNIFPLHGFCTGGSARGLINPESKSGYGKCIIDFFMRHDEGQLRNFRYFLFKFGQVDLEFVYNYRRLSLNAVVADMDAYREFASDTARRYARFLDKIRELAPHGSVIVACSVFPPSLATSYLESGYSNPHIAFLETQEQVEEIGRLLAALEYNSLEERTEIHRFFNAALRSECESIGVGYFDDFGEFIDTETNLLDKRFTPTFKGADHHMETDAPAMGAPFCSIFERLSSIAS